MKQVWLYGQAPSAAFFDTPIIEGRTGAVAVTGLASPRSPMTEPVLPDFDKKGGFLAGMLDTLAISLSFSHSHEGESV